MNALAIIDQTVSTELDNAAMVAITGAGMWHFRSQTGTTSSNWSLKRLSSAYQGQTFHDGYLSKHYIERWEYKRTQRKVVTWDKYKRV